MSDFEKENKKTRSYCSAFFGCDVADMCNDIVNWPDTDQVHADDDSVGRHVGGSYLQPATWRRAEINAYARLLEETVGSVELE